MILNHSILVSICPFLICFFYMFFEGYVLSSYSILCLYLWLTIGVSQPHIDYINKLFERELFPKYDEKESFHLIISC